MMWRQYAIAAFGVAVLGLIWIAVQALSKRARGAACEDHDRVGCGACDPDHVARCPQAGRQETETEKR